MRCRKPDTVNGASIWKARSSLRCRCPAPVWRWHRRKGENHRLSSPPPHFPVRGGKVPRGESGSGPAHGWPRNTAAGSGKPPRIPRGNWLKNQALLPPRMLKNIAHPWISGLRSGVCGLLWNRCLPARPRFPSSACGAVLKKCSMERRQTSRPPSNRGITVPRLLPAARKTPGGLRLPMVAERADPAGTAACRAAKPLDEAKTSACRGRREAGSESRRSR